jgi:flagellar biosynthesis protein FlhG
MDMFMDQASNLRKLMEKEPNASRNETKTIAITSGKGGVGKTNFSASLSIALAQRGASVTLLDADLGLANINVIFGVIPKFNLYHVIKGKKSLRDIIIQVPEGIKIIAGASGFHQLANLDTERRNDFIKSLSDIADDDYMIIDTGAGISQNVLSFVLSADEIIVITTPELTAITDAYGIIKTIVSQSSEKSIKLVVNRINSISEGNKVSQKVINIAGHFLNVKVECIGYIYDDVNVTKSISVQKPFIVTNPKSKAAACVGVIADKIMNIPVELGTGKATGVSSFVKKLLAFSGDK